MALCFMLPSLLRNINTKLEIGMRNTYRPHKTTSHFWAVLGGQYKSACSCYTLRPANPEVSLLDLGSDLKVDITEANIDT